MFYFLTIIWLLSISGLLTIFFKRRFELVATISIILGALLMYPFGYINHLSWGFYLSCVFVLLFFEIIIKWIIKKDYDRLKEFKNNFFTIGLVYFLIVLVYFFFKYRYQGFSNCDEFTHWGPMLKETIRLDGFYSQEASNLIMHKDYPPLFTLIELLFEGFNGFNYSETIAYIGLETFMFSCLIPVYTNLNIKDKKDWLKGLIITIALILVGITLDKTTTASDYAFVYNSIYVDWALASFATYGIYMTYKEKDWGIFKFSFLTLVCVSFILMKQMGLVFWLIILIYAFLKVLFIDKKLDRKMFIKGAIFLIVIPILFYLSWKYIVSKYEITQQFNIGELSIKDFINIITGNTDITWKYEAFRNYILNLLRRPLKLHPFNMYYFRYVLLMIVLIIIVFWFKKESYFIAGTYLIGSIGYATAMMLLYTLFFTVDEAPILASFDRYMVSYLYFGTTLTLLFSFDRLSDNILKDLLVLAILFLFIEPATYNHLEITTSINETPNKSIVVINQWAGDVKFTRENLNGYRLEFNELGYLDGSEQDYNKLLDYLKENKALYIVTYDSNIEEYWNRLEVNDYIFNDEYYDIEKSGDTYTITWYPFSFDDYVIRYYRMGI